MFYPQMIAVSTVEPEGIRYPFHFLFLRENASSTCCVKFNMPNHFNQSVATRQQICMLYSIPIQSLTCLLLDQGQTNQGVSVSTSSSVSIHLESSSFESYHCFIRQAVETGQLCWQMYSKENVTGIGKPNKLRLITHTQAQEFE
jgi:hypothetical protein